MAQAHDFCGESNLGVEGLIDDLRLAYTGPNQLAKALPVALLQRRVASRILERLQALLA
jgi:hypothetical protein